MTISKVPLPRDVKVINGWGNNITEIYLTADGKYSAYRLEAPNGLDLGWQVLESSGKWLGSYNASTFITQIAADFGWEVL